MTSYRPLEGVRVIELTIAWAGPLACRYLAELGADVIKIEHPGSRGLAQAVAAPPSEPWEWGTLPAANVRNGTYPNNERGTNWWNRLGYFNKVNRGKRSLALDMKAPGARAIFDDLVRGADVVINNYSPRGVTSLGIAHPTLRLLNPTIVTLDLSGFGHTGPGADQVSWGPILDAVSGFASTTGYSDSGPYRQGIAFPDAVGALHGAYAAMAALWEHMLTGDAVHVDVSQFEALLGLGGEQLLRASVDGKSPPRRGNRSEGYAPQGAYPCAGDDEWLALVVETADDWSQLIEIIPELGRTAWDELGCRHRDHDEIDEIIAAWSTTLGKVEAADRLQAAGLAAGPVNTNRDIVENGHLAERGFMVDVEHDGDVRGFPGFPIHFAGGEVEIRPTPRLGQHNAEILTELGYDHAAIEALAAAGVIADRPPNA